MTWFIIFTTLLLAQFAVGDSDVEVVTVSPGNTGYLRTTEYGVHKCEFETNTGEKYENEYSSPWTKRDINHRHYTNDRIVYVANYNGCTVEIRSIRSEDLGEWKVTMHFKKKNHPPITKKYKVYIIQDTKVVPDRITVSKGYFINAGLDIDSKNVTNCTLIKLSMWNDRVEAEIDLLNEHTENMQRFGECGFRTLAEDRGSYYWKLKAVVEDKFIYTGTVRIDVVDNDEKSETTQTVIALNRDEYNRESFRTRFPTSSCQLENPMGRRAPIFKSYDSFIEDLTSCYEGVWIARCSVEGNPVPIIRRFRVTRDIASSDTNVILTENNEIKLLFHTYNPRTRNFNFCAFTRPDGYMLYLTPGIGTESYSAFNISNVNSRLKNIYCGLIIHQPKQHDYGVWKCNIIQENAELDEGSIIYVDPRIISTNGTQNTSREFHVAAENVYVKRGDSYEIKCTVDAVLSYCWLRSPNGTSYPAINEQKMHSVTMLSRINFGECIAKIHYASSTDDGEWTCNVGIADGSEESKKILVKVTDGYVIPERSEIEANKEDNVTLSCNILPNEMHKEVHYCRWLRPDGHGIHNILNHRYATSHNSTQCRLTISANTSSEEDIGSWTCVVGLYPKMYLEASATIIVWITDLSDITDHS